MISPGIYLAFGKEMHRICHCLLRSLELVRAGGKASVSCYAHEFLANVLFSYQYKYIIFLVSQDVSNFWKGNT